MLSVDTPRSVDTCTLRGHLHAPWTPCVLRGHPLHGSEDVEVAAAKPGEKGHGTSQACPSEVWLWSSPTRRLYHGAHRVQGRVEAHGLGLRGL